jgi:hypothetical protein
MRFWHFKCVKYANMPSIWSPAPDYLFIGYHWDLPPKISSDSHATYSTQFLFMEPSANKPCPIQVILIFISMKLQLIKGKLRYLIHFICVEKGGCTLAQVRHFLIIQLCVKKREVKQYTLYWTTWLSYFAVCGWLWRWSGESASKYYTSNPGNWFCWNSQMWHMQLCWDATLRTSYALAPTYRRTTICMYNLWQGIRPLQYSTGSYVYPYRGKAIHLFKMWPKVHAEE